MTLEMEIRLSLRVGMNVGGNGSDPYSHRRKNFFYCRYAFGCRLGYVHCAYSTITDITFALRVWEWELGNGN